MPTNLVEIQPEIIDKILQLYQRDQKSLEEDVTTIKKWMENQPHLPEILDDKSIKNFLFINKCSIDQTQQSIDMYYTLRSKIPDMFKNINPNKYGNMRKQMKIRYLVLLPKMTEDMYRIQVFKLVKEELLYMIDPRVLLCTFINLQELRLKEDVMFGDIFVFDMTGVTFSSLTKLTPAMIAKIFAIYEVVYRIPLKAVYFINSPPYITMLMASLGKLMKPHLFEKVHLCEDSSILTQTFPKKILPKDYGGEEKCLEDLQELLQEKYVQYKDRFDWLDQLRVNESLRPQKLNSDQILGLWDNFVNLEVCTKK